MIIETVIMLPCFITTVTGEYLGKNLGDVILILETVPFLIFVFLQCLFVPEILFIVLLCLGIIKIIFKVKEKNKYRNFLIIFALFLIISIIGFFSAYKVFYGAMSV